MQTGKQIVSASINNIGISTGDYVLQDRVQHAASLISDLSTIGVAFATNWVAGIAATVGVATKNVINAVTKNKRDAHEERKTDLLRARSGNTLTNGSRTGE